MIVPWGAVGPTAAVGVYKPPHAPERGMGRPPRDIPLRRERSAPGMSHADTHTPLHGPSPTGGVPSDKALSDSFAAAARARSVFCYSDVPTDHYRWIRTSDMCILAYTGCYYAAALCVQASVLSVARQSASAVSRHARAALFGDSFDHGELVWP
eukprot:scaffold29180_cov140-Isochrysis_galbana.AAC.2